jgi:ribosomal protein L2
LLSGSQPVHATFSIFRLPSGMAKYTFKCSRRTIGAIASTGIREKAVESASAVVALSATTETER